MNKGYELSSEHVNLLKKRKKITDENPESGFTWKETKSKIKRNNV